MKTIITLVFFFLVVVSPLKSFSQALLPYRQSTDLKGFQKTSPYMTLYILQGIAHRKESGKETPMETSARAWSCLGQYFNSSSLEIMKQDDTGWILSTWLVSLMSTFPEESWESRFSSDDRDFLLDFSFRHRLKLSRMMKVQLSLALWRNQRPDDARLVFDSVMDLAVTDNNLGTYWFAEESSWLWGRDSVENHAITLCALCEIYPKDPRAMDLAKWLLVCQKMNLWKSTRTTDEINAALACFTGQYDELEGLRPILVVPCKREAGLVFAATTGPFSTE